MSVDEILRTAARTLEEDVRATVDAHAALEAVEAAGPRRRTGPWLPIAAAVIVLVGLAALVLVALADDDRQPVISRERETTTTTTIIDGPDPGESLGLTLTASPARDVRDGDEVQVVIDDLPAGDGTVELVMCTGDALDRGLVTNGCEPSDGMRSYPATGDRIDATIEVEQILNLNMDEVVDCAAPGVRCAIGVTVNEPLDEPTSDPDEGGPELVGLVGVTFAPVEPLGEPRATVAPSEGLVHGELVTLEGEAFAGSVSGASICAPASAWTPPEDMRPGPYCVSVAIGGTPDAMVPTDQEGRFSIEVRVWRMLASMFDGGAEPIDCAEVACTLELSAEDGRSAPPIPLVFDPSVPAPPVPTLEISPTTGLRPGDPVTITIRDLTPGVEASLFACTLGGAAGPDECGQSTSLDPVVGEADGVVTLTVEAIDPIQYGQTCLEPGVCAVTLGAMFLQGDPLVETVRPVPIQFAP